MKQSGIISLLDEACFLVGTVTDKVREGTENCEGGRQW